MFIYDIWQYLWNGKVINRLTCEFAFNRTLNDFLIWIQNIFFTDDMMMNVIFLDLRVDWHILEKVEREGES